MANYDDELARTINEEEREEVGEDLQEVEGETEGLPRPSEDGDADMDLDERGGNQEHHNNF